jgi:hypothetical protein
MTYVFADLSYGRSFDMCIYIYIFFLKIALHMGYHRRLGRCTVKKAQCNFQLENHVTFHVIGIKIVYNVKIIYISADVKLNSIEFTRFYIVHNVI